MTTERPPLERRFDRLPSVFAKLTGKNGVVREYQALIAPTSECCVLPKVDAFRLGYPEAAAANDRVASPSVVPFASYVGFGRGTAIRMARVEMGGMTFEDVDFLAFDQLQSVGYDVVLGLTLLGQTRLDLDFSSRTLRLQKIGGQL